MEALRPGDEFAGHRIEGVAGRGGMGVVYRATQLALDRTVALKLIAPDLASDEGFRARFVRESRAAAAIEHPNVLPVFSAGQENGLFYIAMRFVDGVDLRGLVRRDGPLEPARAARIVAQLAAALDAAHARGLVHRDVKPANALLGAGDHAYLADFGLTKRVGDGSEGLSRTGGWVGTLGFVAPEQIRGEPLDARSDVYALGCVLFHALAGRSPFERGSDEAMLLAHLHDAPPALGNAFDPILARALAKGREDRYPSAGDLGRDALEAAGLAAPDRPERSVATGAAAPRTTERPNRPAIGRSVGRSAGEEETTVAPRESPRTRRARPVLAAVAVLAAAALLVALLATRNQDDPKRAQTTPAPASTPTVADTIRAVERPNAIVVAAGTVWVAGSRAASIARISTADRQRRPSVKVPAGVTDLAASRSYLWITNSREQTLTRVGLRSAKVKGDPVSLTGRPFALAVTHKAIWIASRRGFRSGRSAQLLIRVDPVTRRVVRTVEIPRGVQNLAADDRAVWITNRRSPSVVRVDVRTGEQQRIPVGNRPRGVALGGDYAWVTDSGDDDVARIDRRTLSVARVAVGDQPVGIAASADVVWVANLASSTLTLIDPRRARTVGEPLSVGLNPFDLALDGRSLWLTALGEGTVQRVTR